MKNLQLLFLVSLIAIATSCQFTETMVMEADGSGTMSMELNLNEMMALGGMSEMDVSEEKLDTIIFIKDILEEKKDSISKLPKEDQRKLKNMEDFKVHIQMDSEEKIMKYDVSIDFKNVSEANDIINALEQVENIDPASEKDDPEEKKEKSPDIVGVNYTFSDNTFVRDAYIKDKELHRQQVDSMKQTESFLAGSLYTLHYTFPKRIKKASNPNAVYSNNKKTIVIKTQFLDYFKDPDILDLEVELEE